MSKAKFKACVEPIIANAFEAEMPGIKVMFPNAPVRDPENEPHVEVFYLTEDSFRANVGGKRVERSTGIIQLDLLVPKDTGTRSEEEKLERVADTLSDQSFKVSAFQTVTFRVKEIYDIGKSGEYYRLTSRIPYVRDVSKLFG